jgi:hypothetical protein
MTSANRRTPRVQGGGDAAPGMPGGIAQHHEKVAGGEVQCGGAPIWWKKCTEGKDAARRRSTGGGRDEAVKLGKNSSSRRQCCPHHF